MRWLRLPIERDPQAACALLERPLAPFEDIAHSLPDVRALKTARRIADRRQSTGRVRSSLGDYHLIRVGVHNQVRVVRDDDDLTPVLGFDEKPDQLVEYRFRIEIFLGLVDDERAIVRFVEREIQQ
jgi:hypothetical protein